MRMKHQLILVAGAAALASFMPFSSLAAEAKVVATNVAYYSDAATATDNQKARCRLDVRVPGGADPQYLPKIDRLAPLAFCSTNVPPIVDVCGEPPYEWPCRAEENRLLVGR